MYAIVDIAGQQFKVKKDQKIFVHRLENKEGSSVDFESVLLIDNDKTVLVGEPEIKGAKIVGKVLSHTKGDKVQVFKKKRRKGYKVLNGHRQYLTQIQIEDIIEKATPKKAAAAKTAVAPKKAAAAKTAVAPKKAAATKTAVAPKKATAAKTAVAPKKAAATKTAVAPKKATAAKTTKAANDKKPAAKKAAKPKAATKESVKKPAAKKTATEKPKIKKTK